jgi:hypothetical protein
VHVPVLPMFDTREHGSRGGPIAFQPIGDEHARNVPTPFEQLPKELFRSCCVAAALHQNIKHSPILIHCPPQVMPLTGDCEEDFVQMPLIA